MLPSLQLIRFCARLSDMAYRQKLMVVFGLKTEMFTDKATDTQGFIAWDDASIFVAFRGTKGLRDILTDLNVKMLDCGRYHVHTGFSKAAGSVMHDVLGMVRKLKELKPQRQLILTGHSLGGALAILVALGLAEAWIDVNHVITFGQPRVGDADFARYYCNVLGEQTLRVVNDIDIVPRSPGVLLGYRQGDLPVLFFNACGCPVINPPLWRLLVSDAYSIACDWKNKALGVASDHFMTHYQAVLRDVPAGALGNNTRQSQDASPVSAVPSSSNQGANQG